jgi:hypothetical protein
VRERLDNEKAQSYENVDPPTFQAPPSAVSNTVFECSGTEGVLVTYQVTVPAGETRSLLLFNQVNSTTTEATTDVGAFNNNTTLAATDFLAGLSQSDLATVVNFDFSTTSDVPTTKAQCKNGGWKDFGYPDQGTCISFVNQNRP